MEKKNLRKTEGLPFTLGMAAGVVLLLETILSFSLSPIITKVTVDYMSAKMNISAAASSGSSIGGTVGAVVSFLVMPGIFLLLLFLGRNKEKRGSTFAVVWIVIAVLSIVSSVASLMIFQNGELQKQIVEAVNTVMPGGYWIENGLALIGHLLIIASCVVFWKRLHEPPVSEVPGPFGQDA
ncbi:hypothetical protein EQM14_00490 [Caproiciproducens sp. NJN-50]|uniref:hypothetical protein n=1 Tax=Acutalibacteraceae TaxID=3082771 RepID=UPI000FFDFC32|nr:MULTISPECIES: hypothetical protein [Acutalibacteraceae]QAT48378.1 hypothetical protein EQM14_00490 [Caproiciproducens sp. NJN-50]